MKLDFVSSYKSPVTEFDRETYNVMTTNGRKLRKVEIYFACLFIFVGFIHYLFFLPFSDSGPQIQVLLFYSFLGIIMITLRSTRLWRIQRIPNPNFIANKEKTPRYTYAYFSNRKPPPRPTSAVPLD